MKKNSDDVNKFIYLSGHLEYLKITTEKLQLFKLLDGLILDTNGFLKDRANLLFLLTFFVYFSLRIVFSILYLLYDII